MVLKKLIKKQLTIKQKELLKENKIDILLFYFPNVIFDLNNYSFVFENKEYKVIHFDIISFYDLLRYLDPSSVYMNRFNGYSYEKLIGENINIRSAHKFRNYIKDYLPSNYDFNSNLKDLLIIKLDNIITN